jgi:uncharacterized protein (TIGR02265 family)
MESRWGTPSTVNDEEKHMKGPAADPGPALLGSEEELRRRLACVTETTAVRGMLFNAVLEVVRQQGGEAAVQRCLAASDEKKFMDFFSYPSRKYLEVLYTAARLGSGGPEDFAETLRRLGQHAAENFLVSAAGRTLRVLVQGAPHRLLNSLPWAIQVGVSGVGATARMTGPWSGLLTVQRDFCPRPFVEGGLRAAFEAARVKGVKVRSWPAGPTDTEYELSWE